ncbi:MAG: ATP-binding cassette domain-containing protein [Myxococcales bacterium]|nr:ATP-binding cassette domain-containing protein [Myxococcales bacterium]
MTAQYTYVMKDLRKRSIPEAGILKDISLSFYPGAKIGVLGLNGSGKSTLLRIMAGVDQEYIGEARLADGIKVGFLPQEPQLDPTKTVLGNIEEAVVETQALLEVRRGHNKSRRGCRPRRWRSCSRSRRRCRRRSTM